VVGTEPACCGTPAAGGEYHPHMEQPTGTVTTIMHDTVDLAGAVAFWTAILGLEVVYDHPPYAYLSKMGEDGPRLAFQEVAEPRPGKNRLHMDIHVPDREAFAARVIELGGSRIGDHQEEGFPTWTVMADPQGNEFCIYDSSEQSSA
jgi:catechol 2,3-dioxygenase-like lactoylglutathione lyase family enzyme